MGFLDDIKNFFNSKPEIKEATNEPKEQVPAEPVENKQVETPSTNQQSGVEEKHGKTTDPQPSTEQHAQVTQTTQNEQPKPTQQPQESAPQIIDMINLSGGIGIPYKPEE
ncbi:MAG: hypothetical protein IKX51_07000, partial [Bacteroidales bacterium]|nr:hypothetical protein [Bacteroidales bacterium]